MTCAKYSIVIAKTKGPKETEISRDLLLHTTPVDKYAAYDVSELSQSQRQFLAKQLKRYDDYVAERLKTVFSFTDWMDQTSGPVDFTLKPKAIFDKRGVRFFKPSSEK